MEDEQDELFSDIDREDELLEDDFGLLDEEGGGALEQFMDRVVKDEDTPGLRRDVEALDSLLREERESKASEYRMRAEDLGADHFDQEIAKHPCVEESWEDFMYQRRYRFLKFLAISTLALISLGVIWSVISLRFGVQDDEVSGLDNDSKEVTGEKLVPIGKRAEAVCRSYLSASTFEEKLKWVRKPDIVGVMMGDYYREQGVLVRHLEQVVEIKPAHSEELKAWYVRCRVEGEDDLQTLVCEEDEVGTLKVSWMMETGYQSEDVRGFVNEGKVTPCRVRALVVPMSQRGYYGYEFSDYRKYRCFLLKVRLEGKTEKLWGYTEKGTELDRMMTTSLRRIHAENVWGQHKQGYPMTLSLVYPVDRESKNCVQIVQLNQTSWLALDPAPSAESSE